MLCVYNACSTSCFVFIMYAQQVPKMNPENIFTPNGDGYNDTWSISNYQYYPSALVLVYNRWGQKVYEHDGLYHIPWDGKDLIGVEVPDATYYYIVFEDSKKESEIKKGSVSIVR